MVRICILCNWKVVELFLEEESEKAVLRSSELSYNSGSLHFISVESIPDEAVKGLSQEELINAFDERCFKSIREGCTIRDRVERKIFLECNRGDFEELAKVFGYSNDVEKASRFSLEKFCIDEAIIRFKRGELNW